VVTRKKKLMHLGYDDYIHSLFYSLELKYIKV